MISGTLFIVATPIGNLKDITQRALEVLGKTRFIACEDTRVSGGLISKLNLGSKNYISFFEGNEQEKTKYILSLLEAGNDVSLVSDGGTPLISDPGYKLVKECRNLGIKVESIPGPSALITALTLSGLPTDRFMFLGFSPKSRGKRINFFEDIKKFNNFTVVFYESPHRILESLDDLRSLFKNAEIVICREMTKIHEEVLVNKTPLPKGEFTIVFRLN